jgi:transposase
MLNESEVGGVALGALEGARSATGSAPSAAVEVKRWSSGRKKQVVLRLLRGESVDALSRELAVPIYRLEAWRDRGPWPALMSASRNARTIRSSSS